MDSSVVISPHFKNNLNDARKSHCKYIMMLIIAYLHRIELPPNNFVDSDLKIVLMYILKFNMFLTELFCQEDIRIVNLIVRFGERALEGENNSFQAVRLSQRILSFNQRFVQGIGFKWHMLDQLHSTSASLELAVRDEETLKKLKSYPLDKLKKELKYDEKKKDE